MTDRSSDPYFDMRTHPAGDHATGERTDDAQPERGSRERSVDDGAERRVPFVDGPTGAAPISSELRGDPEADGDREAEQGAMGGIVAGTALAGPIGGVVGGLLGGTAGAASEADDGAVVGDDGEVRDARLEAGEPHRTRER